MTTMDLKDTLKKESEEIMKEIEKEEEIVFLDFMTNSYIGSIIKDDVQVEIKKVMDDIKILVKKLEEAIGPFIEKLGDVQNRTFLLSLTEKL